VPKFQHFPQGFLLQFLVCHFHNEYHYILLVVNSKSEGFSYTILEGLFYAPALISTPVGIAKEALMPEIIFQEDDLREKILDVKNHYESYQSQQLLLREKALASFTTTAATEQLVSLYRSVL
jgi:glycosyltransferase involved in cell wall biosynthesis